MAKTKPRRTVTAAAGEQPDPDSAHSETQVVGMDEVMDLVWSIARLRQPFSSRLLAGDLAQHIARLKQLVPEPELKRGIASNGLVRVGLVLSRQHEPMTMGELSKVCALPLSTSTHIIDRLVESGYAERSFEPEDRRVVRVALTKSGLKLYESLFVTIQRSFMPVLSRLTMQERADLRRLLHKFTDAIQEAGE